MANGASWWLDEHTVFAGDLAYNGMHAYLADARYDSWLAALTAMEARLADGVTLYLGHGEPAGTPVLAAQRWYIETFIDMIAEHAAGDPEARRAAVVVRMRILGARREVAVPDGAEPRARPRRARGVPLMTNFAQRVNEVDALDVEIPVGAIRLAGVLRVPRPAAQPRPGIVLTGPFTGVKEQVVGTYAAALAGAGFVTLTFDHRNFGASGGEPRQHEDSTGKLEDLRHATSYLAGDDRVDANRLGCVGVCLGGGYALRHSAFDPRIRALAAVAAAFNDPRATREGIGAEAYRTAMAEFAEVDQRQFATGRVDYLPAVAGEPGAEAAMPGAEPFAYYGTDRSASPGWVNRVTRLSIRELLTFDAAMGADFLGPTPALVVHGRRDEFCSPAAAKEVYERIAGPKELMWLDTTNHIDLYDVPVYVEPAIGGVTAWMTKHLG